MSKYKEYTVRVYKDRTVYYNAKGQRHRKAGPAIEYVDGDKLWYLYRKCLKKAEFNKYIKKR